MRQGIKSLPKWDNNLIPLIDKEQYYYYYYKRSNRTPKEEPKDYKTPKSPQGSNYDHQENKNESKKKTPQKNKTINQVR